MAIKVSYTTPDSTVHNSAYIRVRNINLDNELKVVTFYTEIWHTKTARDSGTSQPTIPATDVGSEWTVSGADFTTYFSETALTVAGATTLKNAYSYLKTMYPSAVDV